jgi:hypothetical protein
MASADLAVFYSKVFRGKLKGGGMSDRSLIFNTKGTQIGYIEGDRAFDLTGRERCNYARTTGNLSELNGKKIVGYISLDGTFVGLSWISEELFGKPSREVHRALAITHHPRPKKANLQRPEKSSVKEPKDGSSRTATAPQPENLVEHSPLVSKSGEDPEAGLNTSKTVANEVPVPQGELIVPDPSKSSSTESELFDLAIGMIRSAFEKGPE